MIVKLPDGRTFEYAGSAKLKDVLVTTDRQLLKTVIGAKLNGELVDFHRVLPADAKVELITIDSPEARPIYRHSLSHVLAQAVKRLIPNAKLAIGPAIDDGFYYDFDVEKPFTPEDIEKIEAEMKKVIKENFPFERSEVSRDEAHKLLSEMKEPYKLELLEELPSGETISFYKDGDFVDLCRGPHILGTGQVKHFKLLNVAGAYWRGDEKNKMLQRIYGTAFYTKEELEQFLHMREEAKKRDHRKLGKDLGLFYFSEHIGPGLPLFTPKGEIVRYLMESYVREKQTRYGYQHVWTGHMVKEELYRRSGHYDNYVDSMFPPMIDEGIAFRLKPMNCPSHMMLYKEMGTHSYRDLPLRFAEFATLYRYEKSGELSGLTRVRAVTQDDCHIFCTPDQIQSEFSLALNLVREVLETYQFKDYRVRLSLRGSTGKYVADDEKWGKATTALKAALDANRVKYEPVEGEAAFYGPKADFLATDVLGREWQLSTIQVDFIQPARLGLEYIAEDGRTHTPVVLHRAVTGSTERFLGVLIEHYAGAFPVWLSPVQAVVLPITDKHAPYAGKVLEQLKSVGVRAELDGSNNTLNYRIRHAQLQKTPYMLVVGDREQQNEQVAVRLRTGEDLGAKGVAEFVHFIQNKIADKELI
ncbi:threonine--tRNA ligase [Candidatus Acetothermia bacterium]|nr:threonine--tRNA ligase [Candidatus Acetothermia bacterium]